VLDDWQKVNQKMIRKVNPIAKAMLENRKRKQVVPDKKKHNKKKDRQDGQRNKYIPSDDYSDGRGE
jgi:ribosomal protein L21